MGGSASGDLAGSGSPHSNGFFSKFDTAGNMLWTRQLNSGASDSDVNVASDRCGNVYVSGTTSGNLGGSPVGGSDCFLGKYDAAGNMIWMRQFGSDHDEYVNQVSFDGQGNLYLGGRTDGSLFGNSSGGSDVFVSKLDSNGNLLWGRQFGSSASEMGGDVACDHSGNVYVGGITWGSLGGPLKGNYDSFVRKYDADGNPLWTRQLGTINADESHDIACDGRGNVFISGVTWGSLGGPSAGGGDAFISQLDENGNIGWTCQFGTATNDWGNGMSADELGNVFLSGITTGSLAGNYAGNIDGFAAKLTIVPEPSMFALLLLSAICVMTLGTLKRKNR
jgi:hypothetical protein